MFQTIFVNPIFNLLILLYKYITFEDLGLAIIALTILIRLVLYPLFYKGMKGQSMMQKIQPEIKKVQETHKNDKEAQALALMNIYKENKINPFSSFFYILVQMPVLFAVYRIFRTDIVGQLKYLYTFITPPEMIHSISLGLIDMTQTSIIIVVLAAVAQYIQGKLSLGANKNQQTAGFARYMVFLGPVITIMILPKFSAALGVYWLTTSVFSIFQQRIINKQIAALS